MRILAHLARILVGLEFIFSGFVKVIDPYGTGLKFHEYFEVFANDLPAFKSFFVFLSDQSQILSLLFCALEFVLGVALLFSFRMPKTAWVVLFLMSFFTFLTFYSAYFNKVTDCGCFGDFMKLKPWHSFYKDVVSIFIILVVFINRKKYNESFLSIPAVIVATLFAFGIGLYAKRYLPLIDFLPYAVGKSISEQMKPTGVKPILEYTFLDKKQGEEIVSKEYLMDTLKYKYLSSEILNENEISPKITDFRVADLEDNDFTEETLSGKKLILVIKKTELVNKKELDKIKQLSKQLGSQQFETLILTPVFLEQFKTFETKHQLTYRTFNTDEKVLKAMARTNTVLILLENGTIKGKWSSHNIPTHNKVLSLIKNK